MEYHVEGMGWCADWKKFVGVEGIGGGREKWRENSDREELNKRVKNRQEYSSGDTRDSGKSKVFV